MMELKDLFLTPLYLGLFYAIAFAAQRRFTNVYTRPYFIPALTVKFIGALGLGLIYQFYYKGGDTFNYFTHTKIVLQAFSDSPLLGLKLIFSNGEFEPATASYAAQMYWYSSPTEFFVVRVAALCGLLCFGSYAVIALLFAILSFSGMWAMYITFARIYPAAYKNLAIAVFFLPSVFFWGSGLMKDSLCVGALGWVFYGFYYFAVQKRNMLFAGLMGALGVYVLASVKVYILLSFMPPALLWVFQENNRRIQSQFLRMLLKPLFLTLGLAAGYLGATNLTEGDDRYDVDKIGERTKINQEYLYGLTKDQGSAYNIGSFDGSIGSMATVAPQAIIVTLFRPFPWEARNPVMALSALEALMFIYFTLNLFYRTGLVRSIKQIAAEPAVTFSILFTLVFAVGVGTNSGNFGTLVRYKIPLMPFYLSALYIMQHKARAQNQAPTQSNSPRKLRRLAVTE